MEFEGKVAVITGAASGIGRAVAIDLARRNIRAMALVDMGEVIDGVAAEINANARRQIAYPYRGERIPKAGWVGDAMQKGVDKLPTLDNSR